MNDYKIGQKIWFTHKGKQHEATITRVNKKTVSISTESGMRGRVGYGLIESEQGIIINEPPLEYFVKNSLRDNDDLFEVLIQVSEKYHETLKADFSEDEMNKLNTVSIRWNKQYTYRKLGHYNFLKNEIMISQSIKFSPKYVVEHIIFHELLHIKYNNHGKSFKSIERKCHKFYEAREYEQKLCLEVRHHGVHRLKRLSTIEEKELTLDERYRKNQEIWKKRMKSL